MFGPPQLLLVDRLRANIGTTAQRICDRLDIHLQAGLSHNSVSLAVVERSHRTATDMPARALNDGAQLDQVTLNLLAYALNNQVHGGIGITPLQAMTAIPARDGLSLFNEMFREADDKHQL